VSAALGWYGIATSWPARGAPASGRLVAGRRAQQESQPLPADEQPLPLVHPLGQRGVPCGDAQAALPVQLTSQAQASRQLTPTAQLFEPAQSTSQRPAPQATPNRQLSRPLHTARH
jgi:hypothetical protein